MGKYFQRQEVLKMRDEPICQNHEIFKNVMTWGGKIKIKPRMWQRNNKQTCFRIMRIILSNTGRQWKCQTLFKFLIKKWFEHRILFSVKLAFKRMPTKQVCRGETENSTTQRKIYIVRNSDRWRENWSIELKRKMVPRGFLHSQMFPRTEFGSLDWE